MKPYTFSEEFPDATFSYDFEESLYNTKIYRYLQDSEHWVSFYILDKQEKKIIASIHFHVLDQTARSPKRAPFGGLEFSDSISFKLLFDFLEFAERKLKAKGVRKIEVKNSPETLQGSTGTLISVSLFNLGYSVANAETGAILRVDNATLESRLHVWEQRKLRQARETNFAFRPLPLSEFSKLYGFILSCRSSKNYILSMTEKEVQQMVNTFPERYFLFGLFDGNTLVSASISIRVRQNMLYNFYADHDKQFDSFSPLVMLISGIYDFCHERAINFIDLGTSSVEGKQNFSLIDFKQHLGAELTPKLTFEKNFP